MNRFFLAAIVLFCSLNGYAQGCLDLTSRAAVHRAKMAEKALPLRKGAKRVAAQSTAAHDPFTEQAQGGMLALVKLNDGATAADLSADGFEVKPLRGGFAVVSCTPDNAELLSRHRSVKKCELGRQRTCKMDNARQLTGVETLHSGLALPQAYTGKGVVAGIVDGGFDVNHINFKDAEGNTRFKYFATVEVNSTGGGVRTTEYTPQQIPNFSTDDNSVTHGTHTLGIMAGSFMREATVAVYDEADKKVVVSQANNPYYGVAYNSTLYASTGSSYDALIAYGVDGILAHRWDYDHSSPIVINLSLGGNQGPHDGSGLLSQYLDMAASLDNAVICVSSGNEGDIPLSYNQKFTAENNSFATFIRPYVYTNVRYGIVELYSDTAEDFDVSVIIYNKARKKVARTFPLNNKLGEIQYICSDDSYVQQETDIVDATFAKAYDGYVGVGGMLDSESGRFYVAVDYYVINSADNPADDYTTEAQYTLGFEVKGKSGQHIYCYCDGTFTALDSYGYEGFVDGTSNGTVTDIATGKNIIAVGAFNSKDWAGGIQNHKLGYEGAYPKGEVSSFSSYGTLIDGRTLPHLLAPGSIVVSSMSTPYFRNANNGMSEQLVSVKYNDGKRDNYFYPMSGTSMAAPFVAGTVALMLEANKNLKYNEVRDMLIATANHDDACKKVLDPVQAGAGKLNAVEAVKCALEGSASIKNVSNTSAHRLMLSPTGYRSFNVFLADANTLTAELYNAAGARVYAATVHGNQMDIDAAALPTGVYTLKVNGSNTQKIVVK